MKIFRKYLYLFACTLVIGIIVLYCALMSESLSIHFTLCGSDGVHEITLYESGDGGLHLFLPSYAELGQVKISNSSNNKLILGDVELTDDVDCGMFELDTPYTLRGGIRTQKTLYFHRSANVATMFIDTESGTMARIHQDKSHRETASILLYNEDGTVDCVDSQSTIKGRGNMTWEYDKRPYSLTLSSDKDLLGMGAATNWILLANAADETNMNNKLVLDMGKQAGFAWTPDYAYVDVYLNGEYSGLYMLIERLEEGPERLDIDTASGAFLCKIDLESRWNMHRNPFKTESGRTVEITFPKVLSDAEAARIQEQVNQMERAILSDADLSLVENINLDSWVSRYLIDEIAANIDSDLISSYFYQSDGVIYAGPLWDYDMVLGNHNRNQEPTAFIAKTRTLTEGSHSEYYSVLYENESFYKRMVELYREKFRPVLEEMIQGGIMEEYEKIATASRLNSIRWEAMYDVIQGWGEDLVCTPEGVTEYLTERVAFLDKAWLDGVEFCTVQFDLASRKMYWNISVEKGTPLETDYVDFENTVWIDRDTGEVFDPSQPITKSAHYIKQPVPGNGKRATTLATWDYVVFASVAFLGMLLLAAVAADILRRRKERRLTNGSRV